MSINVKDAKEKLGEAKVEEIVEKDWKLADLPTEEELAAEKHKSSKARSNHNSRKNLAQYQKKSKETKEKIIDNLQFVELEEDVDPADFLGDYAGMDAIHQLMPALDVLSSRQEQETYYTYIRLLLQDFDPGDLTNSDIDDIVTLALNRVIEYRLLKIGAKNPMRILEAAPTIEKFRKFSEKIKGGLASRRVDRIDIKNRPAFSIVDLVAHLDEQEKADFEQRTAEMEKKRKGFVPPKRSARGLLVTDDDS